MEIGKKKNKAIEKLSETKKNSDLKKNIILICISIVLLTYAATISVYPKIVNMMMKPSKIAEELQNATCVTADIDNIKYTVKPNLHGILKIYGLKLKWAGPYDQPLLFANILEIETNNPFAPSTKNFNIKSIIAKNGEYSDQILPDGKNKLQLIAEGFNPGVYKKNKININVGNVRVKDFKIKYITPDDYDEKNVKDTLYSKNTVKEYLSRYSYKNINIK